MNMSDGSTGSWSGGGSAGGMVTVEFTIKTDGTITEKVVGAPGNDCIKVTEKINDALGKVI